MHCTCKIVNKGFCYFIKQNMFQLLITVKSAKLVSSDDDKQSLLSTFISLPILSRSTHINEITKEEFNQDLIESQLCEDSNNPQYNFSIKFTYNHISELVNDLLLTKSTNGNIFLKNDDEIFGVFSMNWKQWILTALNDKTLINWQFTLPIIDPTDDKLNKGEIDLEINFYSNNNETATIEKCDLMEVIPMKYSFLMMDILNISSIPSDWFNKNNDSFISIAFQVKCNKDYSEKIEIEFPLQTFENEQKVISIDSKWCFFLEENALDHYLNMAQKGESFQIKIKHIVANYDKETFDLPLKLISDELNEDNYNNYNIDWINNNDDNNTESSIQSMIKLSFKFQDPLIQVIEPSKVRKEPEIESRMKFQAMIASIQKELKEKYLKLSTTYDNNMCKQERKTKFINYICSSSTYGQKLTQLISQIIVCIIDEEIYNEPQSMIQQFRMKLRSKLNDISNPVFEHIFNTKTDIIYAESLRNIETLKVLINISFLNQDWQSAKKWIIQAMLICNDKDLYCDLLIDLAFIESKNEDNMSISYHCITESLSIKEIKETVYIKILILCDEDKMEQVDPLINKLISRYPNNPHIQILKGLVEYLMEEIEDAQIIWKQQSQNNDINLYDLWSFPLKLALRFNCLKIANIILFVCKQFFELKQENKIDYILLNHHVLMYQKKYESALSLLGKAILINQHDPRIWLNIGQTYYSLNKSTDCIKAFKRHINECNNDHNEIKPNLMAIFQLIKLYSMIDNNENNTLSLIKLCWNRIINNQISKDDIDNINMLLSFKKIDKSLIDALKYKLWCIKGKYSQNINDKTSALSNYSNASMINPFDDQLWKEIDSLFV